MNINYREGILFDQRVFRGERISFQHPIRQRNYRCGHSPFCSCLIFKKRLLFGDGTRGFLKQDLLPIAVNTPSITAQILWDQHLARKSVAGFALEVVAEPVPPESTSSGNPRRNQIEMPFHNLIHPAWPPIFSYLVFILIHTHWLSLRGGRKSAAPSYN